MRRLPFIIALTLGVGLSLLVGCGPKAKTVTKTVAQHTVTQTATTTATAVRNEFVTPARPTRTVTVPQKPPPVKTSPQSVDYSDEGRIAVLHLRCHVDRKTPAEGCIGGVEIPSAKDIAKSCGSPVVSVTAVANGDDGRGYNEVNTPTTYLIVVCKS